MSDSAHRRYGQMISPATDQAAGRHRATVASEIGVNMADLGRRIAELPRGDTFRVVLSRPVGGGLNPRADGLYDAFVKGPDGKFSAVARLSRVGPGFITAVTMLAGHAMLTQISSQIASLQIGVDLVLRLQVAGELGKVKAAITTLRTIHHYERHRDQMLLPTIASLKEAIGGATQQATELIRAIPEPPSSNLRRAVWDTSPDTVKGLSRAREAVTVVLLGLQALAEAEVLLNENLAAAQIMRVWLDTAQADLDLARCERLARMMPANTSDERHEVFWMRVADSLAEAKSHIEGLIEGEVPLRISFECKAEHLRVGADDQPTTAS